LEKELWNCCQAIANALLAMPLPENEVSPEAK